MQVVPNLFQFITYNIIANLFIITSPAIGNDKGNAMLDYFFKKIDVHLCPEVKGRIVNNGKPVAGLEILRQLAFNDFDIIKDTTYTDKNGEFNFSEKNIRLPKRKISIAANVTNQVIIIIDRKKQYRTRDKDIYYRLWQVSKGGINRKKSFSKKLSQLNCELTNKEVYFLFEYNKNLTQEPKYNYYGTSICRWQEDFLIRKTYNN